MVFTDIITFIHVCINPFVDIHCMIYKPSWLVYCKMRHFLDGIKFECEFLFIYFIDPVINPLSGNAPRRTPLYYFTPSNARRFYSSGEECCHSMG